MIRDIDENLHRVSALRGEKWCEGSRYLDTRRATPNPGSVSSAKRRDTRPHEGSHGDVHGTVAKSCRDRRVVVRDCAGPWGDWLGR